MHPYALKLPLPPKTGRELEDDDNAARHEQLKWLISELLRDTTHVAACCNTLSRRLALKEEQIESGSSEQFDSITTVNALKTDWLVKAVERLRARRLRSCSSRSPRSCLGSGSCQRASR